jgi:hypothetical protein
VNTPFTIEQFPGVAILTHGSYAGWLLVLFPATSFTQGLLWQSAFAVMLWVAVALVLRRSALRAEAYDLARNGRFDFLGKGEGLARSSAH